MYPPIEPFATGMLPVSDGNEIYWEASGNPEGKPALHLHGGPGSGIMTGHRKRFDPERYLIVSFEQRGCGRSRPLVTPENVTTNTTQALIRDIEALREHLGVERWLVTGLSWGTTLALAYAQAHPERVSEIVLCAVTATTPRDVAWLTEASGMGAIFPREWERLAKAAGIQPGQRVVDAMYARITDPDPAVRRQAADDWVAWEDTHVSLDPNAAGLQRDQDPGFRLTFSTLVLHYWSHGAFLGESELLDSMSRIAHIPGVLIHGRMDISSPMRVPWELHKAWPGSEFIVVDDEGHGGEKMIAHMVDAYARFAT
jgi:proline iminopeptidase